MENEKLLIRSTPTRGSNEYPKSVERLTCTIFKKKTNRPLYSIGVPKGFSERYGKALGIAKGINGNLDDKTYQAFRRFTLKKAELPKKYEHLIEDFDKKFRVLITNK